MNILEPEEHNELTIRDLKIAAWFVRGFAKFIVDVTLKYDKRVPFDQRIHFNKCIGENCAASLATIKIEFERNVEVEHHDFKQKLINVRNVDIEGGIWGQNFPSIVQWLPNVRRLDLRYARLSGDFGFEQRLEHLVEFRMRNVECTDAFARYKFMASLLESCRQLKRIDVLSNDHGYPKTFLDKRCTCKLTDEMGVSKSSHASCVCGIGVTVRL